MITIPSVELWGPNHARVDGGILPKGQDWSNGVAGYTEWLKEGDSPNAYLLGPNIKYSFHEAYRKIRTGTSRKINPPTGVVISSDLALKMAASPEITEYLKQAVFALAQLRGDAPKRCCKWGLSDILYNFDMFIDDEVIVSDAPDFQWSKSSAIMAPTCVLDGSYPVVYPGSAFYFTRCCR